MDSTLIRRIDTTAILVGRPGAAIDRVTTAFESCGVGAVRTPDVAGACERIPVLMPQVVVVLGSTGDKEREALADGATAVGALLLHLDPQLDDESLKDFVMRAAAVARERKVLRDGANAKRNATSDPPDPGDLDENW